MRSAIPFAINMRVFCCCVALLCSGCGGDFFRFYEVVRTPTDECDIRPNGEFCDPDGLSAPTAEVWSVELDGDTVFVYVDEEVWSGARDADDVSKVTLTKLQVTQREPGPCTTTTTRGIDLVANDVDLSGTLTTSSRTEGPEECGETPFGSRTRATLAGPLSFAP